MNKNKISTYIYNTIVILCIICGAVYAVSQFMHFCGGEVTDNARVCQNIVPQNCRVQGFIREVRFTEFQEVKLPIDISNYFVLIYSNSKKIITYTLSLYVMSCDFCHNLYRFEPRT